MVCANIGRNDYLVYIVNILKWQRFFAKASEIKNKPMVRRGDVEILTKIGDARTHTSVNGLDSGNLDDLRKSSSSFSASTKCINVINEAPNIGGIPAMMKGTT